MFKRLLTAMSMVVAMVGFASTSHAQYMYLDANGDGVRTAADRMNANGVSTPVTLYIITDHDRLGGLSVCNTADGNLTINSYGVAMHATGGTATFSFTNSRAEMATVLEPINSNSTDFVAAFGGGVINPAGKYALMAGTITGNTGSPAISIIPDSPINAAGSGFTFFGTACSGNDFDNTYKLIGTVNGTGDFTDVDGLGAAASANANPILVAPSTASGSENTLFSVAATASDPDAGNTVVISQTNNAPFLPASSNSGAPVATPSLTLTGTPNFTQSGAYTVNWTANDNTTGTAAASTAITIANTNRNPAITAPPTVSGTENTLVSITGSASDPDAQNVTLSQTNNAAFLTGAASAGPALNPSITLTGTPSFTQSGSYSVNWSANDGAGGTAAATTAISIANLNRNPVIVAPATQSGTEGTLVSITGSASDPDAQTVTLSQTNNAAFLTGPASAGPSLNPSITLTGTPSNIQSGVYAVNWSANDGAGGSSVATTSLTIADQNQAPVITRPASVSGTENTLVSITGSATDPDGQNVTLSQTNNAAFLTGPASAGPVLNPSITLTGTPSFTQSGSYTVNWSATDASAGTAAATTALTIANLNRNPAITAPATVSGTENTAVSITGSASDPDGQNVTLSQTNNAAFLTGPASAGPVLAPSITLTGTPSFTQSGSYSVSWSANDGAGGTAAATTALTIANLNRNPAITAPATQSGTEGTAVSITGSASDPDGQNVTLSQTNNAAFLTGPASAGPALNPSITLTGTPSTTQSGSYTVNWSANDGAGGTAAATTALSIADLNGNPVITRPATVSGTENTLVSITGSATDPDGQNVTLSQTNNAAFLTGPASAGPALNPSITLTGTPSFSQSGSYTVNWSATDASAGSATATTALTIANLNRVPVITAPATVSGTENTAVSITGSASDPDAENVTLSQTNNAAFLAGPASAGPVLAPSITLTGTPSFTQSGSYTVNWSATDASAGTAAATTALTIANLNRNPAITAPATVSGTENTAVSITGSASDPDGQNVTLSQTNNAAFLTGPASAGPVLAPSITLTGTPSFTQSGSYSVSWSANDGAGGTAAATTALTIANLNRNPAITAPANASGAAGTTVAVTGSASDPDGQNVTLSQTNNAPFYPASSSSGPSLNPSITLSATGTAGSFTINWSANDGAGGTAAATTALTVTVGNQTPVISAPATVSGTENTAVSITGSATDPDAGQLITLSQTNNAAFLTGAASAGPASNPSITLTGTPSFTQSGSYTVNWTAVDNNTPTAATATASTALTIANLNRVPAITAPATVSGTENTAVSITGSATDPDGQNVTLSQTNNAAFLTGAASAGPLPNPSITLTGTPSFTQSGSYSVNWSATDVNVPAGTAAATTALTIANLNRNPAITAPATVSGTENTAVSITGSASDPDAQNVTLSQTNNAAFLTGAASSGPALNPSITLTGTPSFSQSGSYTVNWSANDGTGGTAAATTALTIANLNQNPVITAPATVSGTENTLVSITGSASDPDAQNVTLSQTNNAAFLTGAASAGPALNPSITLTGTPSFTQSGSYSVSWSANDGAGGTAAATTALTIANLNRNPVIVAPATASGPAGTTIAVTGSASDPDGQNVTLSQTNNAPFYPASSSSGPSLNPSITLSATGTTGSFTINWSATDGAGGTAAATTALTVGPSNQAPVITRPATVSGTENTAVSITGSATDPEGNQVTLSQTNNAAFLTGPASAGPSLNPSITLTGTPSFSQSGSYTVNWTAVDNGTPAATSTATTSLTIANLNRVPVITAPATVSGSENTAVSVTGSATDPDAETVTLSQTNNAAFLAGPSSAGPVLNPSITLTGTPSFTQSGSYTVNWSAVDASAGTAAATTAITIANVNRNPAITAPASVSGATLSPVSVTGSASDPDGQNVTLSQTNNAPFFTASSSNGPSLNPSITLTGTPSATQSGSFTINWSANDGAGGTAAATTALSIGATNRNPVITAPATVSGTENTAVSITGSASDPDAGQLVTLSQTNNAAFLAGPASAGPLATPSITLTGTPNFSQSGSYTVSWSAVDNNSPTAGSATASTALTIANLNRNPSITAPATVSGTENVAVSVTGSASDPDAENVTLSQTNNAAFLAGAASAGPALNPSITLSGTPSFSQSGSYTVNWSAVDGSTGTAAATTAITIANFNRPPTITAPASVSGTEGTAVSITGSASDADAQNVTLSQTNNAAFLAGAASAGPALNPSITLTGTPSGTQSGSYTVNWSANDGTGGTAAATTALSIANQNQAPTLAQPVDMTVNEGDTATQQLVGSDADGDPLTYTKVGTTPFFMSVSASGAVLLSPGFTDAGAYTGTVRVSDGAANDTKSFSITVNNVNRCPTANAGGPYTGVINIPVSLSGTGSSDPDGDVLSYNWDFGDGASIANGATLTHTYTAAGLYTVTLTVSDGTCPSTATTTANIVAEFPANSFAVGGNTKTSLAAGKPFTCIQIEPVSGSFTVADVNLSSIRLIYNSNQIFADGSKTSVDGDKNGNGVTEISACFSKADMRILFSGLPNGTSNVDVTIKGDMLTGGSFTTEMVMVVKSNGSFLAASISPNPLNPRATLSFATSKPGAVKVQMFDVNGRLLRTIADETNAAAGYHDYTIDGKTGAGDRMASGIYFVKVWTEHDGVETKSITLLK